MNDNHQIMKSVESSSAAEIAALIRADLASRIQVMDRLQAMSHEDRAQLMKDEIDKTLATLLHVAAYENDAQLVRQFVGWGADLEAQDRDGERPVHWAASANAQNSLSALIDAGADKNAKDAYQETPLMKAALSGSPYTFISLLEAGADQKVAQDNGVSVMDIAQLHESFAEVLRAWEAKAIIRNAMQAKQVTP